VECNTKCFLVSIFKVNWGAVYLWYIITSLGRYGWADRPRLGLIRRPRLLGRGEGIEASMPVRRAISIEVQV
jgi:hypothetical protein